MAKAKWLDLHNQAHLTEYKIRLLKHALLTVKDRPDVFFKTEMVEQKRRGFPPRMQKIKYRCWMDSFTDMDTGQKVEIIRRRAIYVNDKPVTELGFEIIKPELD